MQKRKFSRDFKLAILQEIDAGKQMAQACREHDIAANLVVRWKREYQQNQKNAFAGKGNTYKIEAKNAELTKTIGELYLENAILKKANTRLQELWATQKKNTR
ncbi:MAG: transposase [Candidatus Micrarchaeota archaeon]